MPFRCYANVREVPRVAALSDEDFYWKYLWTNMPVIVGDAFLQAAPWPAFKDWVTADGQPNLDRLRALFADVEVPVVECTTTGEYGDQPRRTMRMGEFLDYWARRRAATPEERAGMPLLYLKDWHLARNANGYVAYTTPEPLQDDWLNAYWDALGRHDDYRFCYIGPAGSWTPCHADVLWSYSWSTNVVGRKRWTLFPPSQVDLLRHGRRPDRFVSDVRSVDPAEFPRFAEAKPIVVEQGPGETIFVPSGWYHQVENLEDTISINHNWGNACNVDLMWAYLRQELTAVQQSLAHLRKDVDDAEWRAMCERVLKTNVGMNVADFVDYLRQAQARVLAVNPPPWPAPAPTGPALGRRRSSQCASLHDRRQWSLLQLLKVAKCLAVDAATQPGVHALCAAVEDEAVKEGFGMGAPVQPARATVDAALF